MEFLGKNIEIKKKKPIPIIGIGEKWDDAVNRLNNDYKKTKIIRSLEPPKRYAVGYVRVSTIMQKELGFSILAQIDAIEKHCLSKGFDLKKIYKDEGISGKDIKNRSQLLLMLDEIQPGEVLVVFSISRFSRDANFLSNIFKHFEEKKVSVNIIDIGADTSTDHGKLVIGLLSTIAESERKQISKNVKTTMEHMKQKGILITKPRYGFMVAHHVVEDENGNKKKKSVLVPEQKEQDLIEFIRDLKQENPYISYSEITRRVNDNVLHDGKTWKNRKGNKFSVSTIKNIMIDNKIVIIE